MSYPNIDFKLFNLNYFYILFKILFRLQSLGVYLFLTNFHKRCTAPVHVFNVGDLINMPFNFMATKYINAQLSKQEPALASTLRNSIHTNGRRKTAQFRRKPPIIHLKYIP